MNKFFEGQYSAEVAEARKQLTWLHEKFSAVTDPVVEDFDGRYPHFKLHFHCGLDLRWYVYNSPTRWTAVHVHHSGWQAETFAQAVEMLTLQMRQISGLLETQLKLLNVTLAGFETLDREKKP